MERWIRLAVGFVLAGTPAPASPPTPLQIRLPLEKIAGTVVDEDGRGVGGAKVSAIASIIEPSPRGIAETGPDGSFVILGLYRGAHHLVVEAPRYKKEILSWVEAGDREVRIALTLLRAVEGRVFDAASGEGLPNFLLEAREVAQPGSGRFQLTGLGDRAFQDKEGRFVFDGLVPGRYALLARADGYAQAYSPEFEVAREIETPFLGIALSKGGRLAGRLVDGKTGKGVSGVVLTTRDNSYEDSPFLEIFRPFLVTNVSSANVRSGGDGSYVIDHLMPGTYQVEIEHPSYTKEFMKDLLVREGKETRVPDIAMSPGATLRGLVVDAAGAPVAKADVRVRTSADRKSGLSPWRLTRTDADGRFVARHLPAGEYVVAATPGREENSDPFVVVCHWPVRTTVLLDEGGDVEVRIVFHR